MCSNTDIKNLSLDRAHVGVFVLKTGKVQVAKSLASFNIATYFTFSMAVFSGCKELSKT